MDSNFNQDSFHLNKLISIHRLQFLFVGETGDVIFKIIKNSELGLVIIYFHWIDASLLISCRVPISDIICIVLYSSCIWVDVAEPLNSYSFFYFYFAFECFGQASFTTEVELLVIWAFEATGIFLTMQTTNICGGSPDLLTSSCLPWMWFTMTSGQPISLSWWPYELVHGIVINNLLALIIFEVLELQCFFWRYINAVVQFQAIESWIQLLTLKMVL